MDEIVQAIDKCVCSQGLLHQFTHSPIHFRQPDRDTFAGDFADGVTEESIKQGISVPRNKLLFENAKDILPYTGIGSGIMRAMQSYDNRSKMILCGRNLLRP